MSYYDKHVFFCTNKRDNGDACCSDFRAPQAREYVKERVKELDLDTETHRIRINSAGCLGRCTEGPVIVIYPEEVWYTYIDQEDLDEIIEEHLRHGRIVERLKI
jgi:(2Fe-2S) ferredoxin